MSFTIPTLDETHEFLIAQLKALMPGANVARSSFWWKFTRVLAAGGTDNHAHVFAVMQDLLPDSAEGAALDRWGDVVGVTRKGATAARKDNALRVEGNPGAAATIGDELTSDGGLRFQVNENATIPAAGFIDVDIVAISVGAQTRLEAGEQLTFVAAPVGVNEVAELQLDLDEAGEDDEADGAYRLRILSRFHSPPLGGAQNDYVQWALETAGIASAYAYPNRAGYGSVDLAALNAGTGTSRNLLAGEITALQAAIDELRPVSVKAFRVLSTFAEEVDVEVQILSTGEAAYAMDWDDSTPAEVLAWTAGTRTVQLQGDRPPTMKAGDRIVIDQGGVDGGGEVLVIEALGVADDEFILEEAPTTAPVNGDLVYAGGPLTEPVRDAIIALFDSLGTANPDDVRYGDWEGTLRISSLYRVINSVAGVIDSEVDAPVANIEATDPAFPNDDSIGLLVPRAVLVRKLW